MDRRNFLKTAGLGLGGLLFTENALSKSLEEIASTDDDSVEFPYTKEYPRWIVNNIHSLRKHLRRRHDSDLVDAIFSHQDFALAKFEKGHRARNYQEYLDIMDIEKKKVQIMDFFEEYKEDLRGAYEKHGVDPRAIAAHLGVETIWGEYEGKYKLVGVLSQRYVHGGKTTKDKYRWHFNKFLEFAELQRYTADYIVEQKSSTAGAWGYPQFMPDNLMRYAKGKNGTIEGTDPRDMTDAIYMTANFLREQGKWNPDWNGKTWAHHKSGNRNATWRYNRSRWYSDAIWKELMPELEFKTVEELRNEVYINSFNQLESKKAEFKGTEIEIPQVTPVRFDKTFKMSE